MEESIDYLEQKPNRSFQLLRQATGPGSRISVERIYIDAMDGDLLGGLFVSQVVFWSQHTKRKDGWFYRSHDEWQEKDYLSRYQVDKYAAICVEAGWLQIKNARANGSPTRHYLVDQDAFVEWITQKSETLRKFADRSEKNSNSLELRKFADHEQTSTDTEIHTQSSLLGTSQEQLPQREKKARETVQRANDIGLSPKVLTVLTNTLLVATGLKAIVDAGDDLKLREAQDTAIQMARIGYGTTDAIKELIDRWKEKNSWRDALPTLRNLKEFASQLQTQAATNSQVTSSWEMLNQDIPDYMKEN